jgi:hypothetical protein
MKKPEFKIIIPASEIPHGTTVYKATGTTPMKLIKEGIKIYADGGSEVLYCNSIMTDCNGSYHLYNEDKLFAIWFKSRIDMTKFLLDLMTDKDRRDID